MPRAHPIVGWKGFEDVLASEYGEERRRRVRFVPRADLASFLVLQLSLGLRSMTSRLLKEATLLLE